MKPWPAAHPVLAEAIAARAAELLLPAMNPPPDAVALPLRKFNRFVRQQLTTATALKLRAERRRRSNRLSQRACRARQRLLG